MYFILDLIITTKVHNNKIISNATVKKFVDKCKTRIKVYSKAKLYVFRCF